MYWTSLATLVYVWGLLKIKRTSRSQHSLELALANLPWLINAKKKDILYLTYNEIVDNKKATIEKISSFLQVDFNKIDTKRVIEKSSLSFMKRNQKLFGERITKTNKNFNHSNFIRKGGFGDGQKKFNPTITNIYKTHKFTN